jgi:hypothetical protein
VSELTRTRFEVGQVVRSRTNTQALRFSAEYVVVGKTLRTTAFGTFVTYFLVPEGAHDCSPRPVFNAHLVLEPAP